MLLKEKYIFKTRCVFKEYFFNSYFREGKNPLSYSF